MEIIDYREGRKMCNLWLPTRTLMKWRLNNTAQRRTNGVLKVRIGNAIRPKYREGKRRCGILWRQ